MTNKSKEYCKKCHEEKLYCMCLPEGKACDDCSYFKKCLAFGITKEGQTKCDWYPVKFI